MGNKAISFNQHSGITAGSININKNKSNKIAWSNPWIKYVVIPLIVTIVAGLIVLGVQMFGSKKPDKSPLGVATSYNQEGGLTVGNIENLNLGNLPRQLTSQVTTYLDSELAKRNAEGVCFLVYNDAEAASFTTKVQSYLLSKGIKLGQSTKMVIPTPFYGLSFDHPTLKEDNLRKVFRCEESYIFLFVGANPAILA